jgi:hypothetical protein
VLALAFLRLAAILDALVMLSALTVVASVYDPLDRAPRLRLSEHGPMALDLAHCGVASRFDQREDNLDALNAIEIFDHGMADIVISSIYCDSGDLRTL